MHGKQRVEIGDMYLNLSLHSSHSISHAPQSPKSQYASSVSLISLAIGGMVVDVCVCVNVCVKRSVCVC